MTYSVVCRAEFRPEGNDPLRASIAFTDWVRNLPADAELFPIMWGRGSQRDPIDVLVGLKAKWTEER